MKKLMFVNITGELSGPSKSLNILLTELKKRKYDLSVILPRKGWFYEVLKNEGFNVKIISMPKLQIPRTVFELFYKTILSIFQVINLTQIFIRSQVEVIHVNSSILLLPAIAAKLARKKLVIHSRESLTRKNVFNRVYLNLIGKLADSIVGVSNAPLRQFRYLGFERKLKVIFNGINSPKIKKEKPGRDFKIGTIAFLIPSKGQSVFIQAAIELQKYDFDEKIIFEIVGDLPVDLNRKELNYYKKYKDFLIKLKKKFDKKNHIRFLGHSSDIFEIMKNWDIVVIPSVFPDSSPRVILEAFSLGIPVIGSEIGGIPDTIGDAGILFKSGDYIDLANKIKELIKDRKKLSELSEAAKERLEKYFTAEKHCDNMLRIFEEVSNE